MPSRSAALAVAFGAGSLTAWLNREHLLQVVAAPLASSFRESPCSQHSFSDQIPSLVQSYSSMALTAGALLALPFAAQLVVARFRWGPRIKQLIAGAGFVALSYVLEAVGVTIVARVAPPRLIAHLLGARGWCGDDWVLDTTSTIQWYVARVCLLVFGGALLLQACSVMVVVVARRANR